MCTCWRSERGVNRIVAAAPPAQLDAPARLQPVQLGKALAPRRVALWHARDWPRRIEHLPSPHWSFGTAAHGLDTHGPTCHHDEHGHQGVSVPTPGVHDVP